MACAKPLSKVHLDLAVLDAQGLAGPPSGKRALSYELCVPGDDETLAAVRAIDPTLEFQRGSRGRIGCAEGEVLAVGNTHQPHWLSVLENLAALPYVDRIEPHFAE